MDKQKLDFSLNKVEGYYVVRLHCIWWQILHDKVINYDKVLMYLNYIGWTRGVIIRYDLP